jgi:hypothetical protein
MPMRRKTLAALLLSLASTACAIHPPRPGMDDIAALLDRMGPPAIEWTHPDGSRQLAWPTGPRGTHTHMAHIAPDGTLRRLENVLDAAHFARVETGMTTEDVARLLGPVAPGHVTRFPARDELVWEWLHCDDWNQLSRFHVLFDATTLTVRSTLTLPDTECELFRTGCGCGR